jgi:putative membrane protein
MDYGTMTAINSPHWSIEMVVNPVASALIAYAHFAAIFITLSLLVAEIALYARGLPDDLRRVISLLDLGYLGGALALVATGILRVATSPKGTAFYLDNPIFWTKMALFGLVALLSIPPTMHYLGRYRASYGIIRLYQAAQLAVFFAIPLCATLMARGV